MDDQAFSIIVWLGLCLIVGALATHKNRSFLAFFALSAVLSPIIGGLVLLFIKKKAPERIEVILKPTSSDSTHKEENTTPPPSYTQYEEEKTTQPPDNPGFEEEIITPPPSDFEYKSEKKINHLFLFVGVCVFAVIIACVALIAKSNTNDNRTDSGYGSIGLTTQGTKDDNQNTRLDGLGFVIENMMFARHNGNLKYMDMAEEGLVNCIVYVDVSNETKRSISLKNYDAVLICDGIEYDQFLWEDSEFLFYTDSISAEERIIKKAIDFQIPKEQQYSNSEIILSITSSSGEHAAWKLR